VVSQVQWFKPSWCDQFPIGKYRLRVGDITVFDQKGSSCDQRPCVHLENVPYYLDDDTACDEADFATNSSVEPALLLLEVCSVNDGICVDDSNTATEPTSTHGLSKDETLSALSFKSEREGTAGQITCTIDPAGPEMFRTLVLSIAEDPCPPAPPTGS
jgi:hypothetical protein